MPPRRQTKTKTRNIPASRRYRINVSDLADATENAEDPSQQSGRGWTLRSLSRKCYKPTTRGGGKTRTREAKIDAARSHGRYPTESTAKPIPLTPGRGAVLRGPRRVMRKAGGVPMSRVASRPGPRSSPLRCHLETLWHESLHVPVSTLCFVVRRARWVRGPSKSLAIPKLPR